MSDNSVKLEPVDYEQGGEAMLGYVAAPESASGKLPVVVFVHNWMGEGEYTRGRAKLAAELGYIGFSSDIFGTASRPKDWSEAAGFAGKYYADRPLMNARSKAAVDAALTHPNADPNKVVICGYCFGGSVSLELARTGENLAGVASFHGGLQTGNPDGGKHIKGKVLVMHGADDPWVPQEQVTSFIKEMQEAKTDWQLIQYGNAVHGFTDLDAGSDNSKGAAYNELADKRSWIAFTTWLAEVFA
jgi:dienelactone hydrolase